MRQLLVLICVGVVVWCGAALLLPAHPAGHTVVSVPMGASATTVAKALKEANAVQSALVFKWAARLTGQSGDIKAGDYEVPAGLNTLQTLELLVSGRSLMHRFLVREGLSAAQIAALVEQQGMGSAAAFMAIVQDPAQVKRLQVPGPTLEGYLFPDSYFLAKGMSEEALVEMMVDRFHDKVPDSLLAQGSAIKLRPAQVMTMASIIEKEAKADKERPVVSAVFRNRMKLKKRLESCATVRYAINKWTGPLYNKDLLAKSPYNTYQVFGLPPGPICSPGLASINAALHPVTTDALYFVVAGDGTHIFSKTYEEHLKAKARWKKLKKGIVED